MSSAAGQPEPVEVLRWYTSALRIPRLIGKLTSGERIWGGPYTLTQAAVGVAALVIGVKTMPWWGPLHLLGEGLVGFVGNWTVVAGVAFALVKVSGSIPTSRVNAGLALRGGTRQLTRRPSALWRGERPQVGRQVTRGGRVVITDLSVASPARRRPAPSRFAQPEPATEHPSAIPSSSTESSSGLASTTAVVDKLTAFVGR